MARTAQRSIGAMVAIAAAMPLLALAGCTGMVGPAGGEGGSQTDPDRPVAEGRHVDALESPMRRLTQRQYENVLRGLVGGGLELDRELPVDPLPADAFVLAEEVTRSAVTTTLSFDRYAGAAEVAARFAIGDDERRAEFLRCEPVDERDSCIGEFFQRFLRRAFRQSPRAAQVERYQAIVTTGVDGGLSLNDSLEMAVAAVLQSPKLIYRVELAASSSTQLTPLSLASRLAFFLTDTGPDDALLSLAEADLLVDTTLADEVDRLIASDAGQVAMEAHLNEVFAVGEMYGVVKALEAFPELPQSFGVDAGTEVSQMISSALLPSANFMEFFDAQPAPSHESEALTMVYGDDANRRGFFTTAGYLGLNATPVRTSVTRRGYYIRTRVLCDDVPPPPPSVMDAQKAPTRDAITARDRSAEHSENATCAGCHDLMDPMGLTLEHYDAIGRYREVEEVEIDGELFEAELDVTGEVDGMAVDGARQLGEAVAQSPAAQRCASQLLFRRAFARRADRHQEDLLGELTDTFAAEGFSYTGLVRAVAMSPEFQSARQP